VPWTALNADSKTMCRPSRRTQRGGRAQTRWPCSPHPLPPPCLPTLATRRVTRRQRDAAHVFTPTVVSLAADSPERLAKAGEVTRDGVLGEDAPGWSRTLSGTLGGGQRPTGLVDGKGHALGRWAPREFGRCARRYLHPADPHRPKRIKLVHGAAAHARLSVGCGGSLGL
jgi:hypothetical protein